MPPAFSQDFEAALLAGKQCQTARFPVEMTINEVDDVCDVKGMHRVTFYGNCARQLRSFCQLCGIDAVA